MPRIASGLAFIYSGGPSNVTPNNSIGGQASQAAGRYIASQIATPSTIPGVTITHATRHALGTGTLSYAAANQSISWLSPDGYLDVVIPSEDGMVSIGSIATGFLRLSIDVSALPLVDHTQLIAISPADESLFTNPTPPQLASGVTDYRCVYLVNESNNILTGVTVDFTSYATQSLVQIGSLFDPLSVYGTPSTVESTFRFDGYMTGTGFRTHWLDPLAHPEFLDALTPTGHPQFLYYPSDNVQSSNGIDEDVAPMLTDRYDSTNVLASVLWGNSLFWPTIAPGRMVSFYIKRTVPPNPVIPTPEYIDFDMLVTIT